MKKPVDFTTNGLPDAPADAPAEPTIVTNGTTEPTAGLDPRDAIRAHFAKLRKEELAGVQFLPQNATAEERVRYDLCQDICRIFNERKMSIQALAQGLGMSIDKTNLVIHSQYRSLGANELSRSFERLMLSF